MRLPLELFFRRQALAAAIVVLAVQVPEVVGRIEELFTSSVSYCSPPQSLLIQQFDISYIQPNTSLSFNISAASVSSSLNVSASLLLSVYGLTPLNLTLDLCSILDGALCPLPTYNFTGADSIMLPDSVDTGDIPAIAYVVPDLEAFAQLELVDQEGGGVVACVQSTLSNGWSMRQVAVEWTTGGLTLTFLLLGLTLTAFYPSSPTTIILTARLVDLIGLFQHIASSGLLALNFPLAYRSFTLNFSWALGLFSQSAMSPIQDAINNMRHVTGGGLADGAGGSALDLVDRQLSPYNQVGSPLSRRGLFAGGLERRELLAEGLDKFMKMKTKRDTTVQVQSSNVLQAGVPVWVNALGIGTANAFMTAFFTALILLGGVLVVVSISWGVILLCSRRKDNKWARTARKAKKGFEGYVRGWILRISLITSTPLLIFSFFQFTLKDSWLSTVLAAITFTVSLFSVAYPAYRVFWAFHRYRRSSNVSHSNSHSNSNSNSSPPNSNETEMEANDPWDSTKPTPYHTHGPLYLSYKRQRAGMYFLVPLVLGLMRVIFIALAQASGVTQVVACTVLEGAGLLGVVVGRAYGDNTSSCEDDSLDAAENNGKKSQTNSRRQHTRTRNPNFLPGFTALVKFLATGLQIAFVVQFGVQPIPRVVIGVVVAVVYSVGVVVGVAGVVWGVVGDEVRELIGGGRGWVGRVLGRGNEHGQERGEKEEEREVMDVDLEKGISSSTGMGSSSSGSQTIQEIQEIPVERKKSGESLYYSASSSSKPPPTTTSFISSSSSSSTSNFQKFQVGPRPANPTPERFVPLDPSVIRRYPSVSPTTPSSSSALAHQAYQNQVGSQLGEPVRMEREMNVSAAPTSPSMYSEQSEFEYVDVDVGRDGDVSTLPSASASASLSASPSAFASPSPSASGSGSGSGSRSASTGTTLTYGSLLPRRPGSAYAYDGMGFCNSPRETDLGSWTSGEGEGESVYTGSQPPTPGYSFGHGHGEISESMPPTPMSVSEYSCYTESDGHQAPGQVQSQSQAQTQTQTQLLSPPQSHPRIPSFIPVSSSPSSLPASSLPLSRPTSFISGRKSSYGNLMDANGRGESALRTVDEEEVGRRSGDSKGSGTSEVTVRPKRGSR